MTVTTVRVPLRHIDANTKDVFSYGNRCSFRYHSGTDSFIRLSGWSTWSPAVARAFRWPPVVSFVHWLLTKLFKLKTVYLGYLDDHVTHRRSCLLTCNKTGRRQLGIVTSARIKKRVFILTSTCMWFDIFSQWVPWGIVNSQKPKIVEYEKGNRNNYLLLFYFGNCILQGFLCCL